MENFFLQICAILICKGSTMTLSGGFDCNMLHWIPVVRYSYNC